MVCLMLCCVCAGTDLSPPNDRLLTQQGGTLAFDGTQVWLHAFHTFGQIHSALARLLAGSAAATLRVDSKQEQMH